MSHNWIKVYIQGQDGSWGKEMKFEKTGTNSIIYPRFVKNWCHQKSQFSDYKLSWECALIPFFIKTFKGDTTKVKEKADWKWFIYLTLSWHVQISLKYEGVEAPWASVFCSRQVTSHRWFAEALLEPDSLACQHSTSTYCAVSPSFN